MRTPPLVLVQFAALLWAAGAAAQPAAGGYDYGTHETRGGAPTTTPSAPKPQAGPPQRRPAQPRAQTPPPVETPPRGMPMRRVLRRYGAPQTRHAAVGRPPIARWDYPGYRLYFEYNRVIHAVIAGAPEPLVHAGRLTRAPR